MNNPISEPVDGNSSFNSEIIYLPEHNVIKIIVSGIFSVSTNDQFIAASLAAAQHYNSHLVILDMRKVDIAMNHVEIYDLPERNKLLGVTSHYRVAILDSQTSINSRKFKFYEDRAALQNLERRLFTDENAAIDWLLQK